MSILAKIVSQKRQDVIQTKLNTPISEVVKLPMFNRDCHSLAKRLKRPGQLGIIAEFKRKSPSRGQIIRPGVFLEDVVAGYEMAGVSGVSVLTDTPYFGGNLDDLHLARQSSAVPILRKDFIIDEYQLFEAKAHGADVILLIAACLLPADLRALAARAKSLGLDVLMEVHDEHELETCLNQYIDMVGVNNRNLKTFDVSLETSLELSEQIPPEFVKVAESGIHTPDDYLTLRKAGYEGFLIGQQFMETDAPDKACQNYLGTLAGLVGK
ncbi:indole-3-glycerol phosphate synthase TrpC [Pontibacter sp. G13]|uniref:indole-3-glycerol phosphate synthase TrpC n=1 Tax=Pontibacter sp. G13 TaxID=3074898 RepID=UPI00288A944A|nr:indole-3-glycerol phosphate synthase TrpC [Pontibacter sp. G13]WNJ19583.1 indole-3-glycerol phosphate synthase TrpC [Pontibacter sp. G13]